MCPFFWKTTTPRPRPVPEVAKTRAIKALSCLCNLARTLPCGRRHWSRLCGASGSCTRSRHVWPPMRTVAPLPPKLLPVMTNSGESVGNTTQRLKNECEANRKRGCCAPVLLQSTRLEPSRRQPAPSKQVVTHSTLPHTRTPDVPVEVMEVITGNAKDTSCLGALVTTNPPTCCEVTMFWSRPAPAGSTHVSCTAIPHE